MAEKISLVESFLNCHVCSETFRDPVSLSCNHSFCSSCLQKFWEQAENKNCPICKRKPLNDDPEVNLTLKKLSDSFAERQKSGSSETEKKKKKKEELVCDKHPEVFYWFCQDEERAVCPVCEFSLHHGHKAVPVEQAISELKEQLKSDLKSLQDKRDKYKQLEETYSEVNDHSMKQLLSTEKQIRAEFNKLHQFLKEEEESRLAALREEEEQTRKTVSREMKMIEEQISSLSDIISAVEENLQKHSMSFLRSYKPTQTRARDQCSLSDPQLVSGALIDVAKHLGSLFSRVWEKIKDKVHFSPVILDPNTANCSHYMSDDLNSVRHEDIKQELPDNPESHTNDITAHGSEGFSSGKQSWEVEVGDHASWNASLVKELVDRKGEEKAPPKEGICCFTHHSGECIDVVETDTGKENLQRNSCKRKPLNDDPEVNLPRKELADSFAERQKSGLYEAETKKRKEEVVCDNHPEVSYWFCEVEERALCPICEFSLHHGHRLVPIEQPVSKLKEQLQYALKSMKDKRDKYKQVEKTYNEVIQHSKKQLLSTERKIRAEFNKLHQFLKEEEESRLAALREEEEQKGKTISREMKMIEEQILSLSDIIPAVEEDLQKHNVSFLSSYKPTYTRARDQCSLSDPQVVSGALIDVAKHLGNLSFKVWEKMKDKVHFSPVILNPNTANHWLLLSDDLTSVRHGDTKQQLPDNPERHIKYVDIHGSEGFSSGKHSWVVEVGDHPDWTLGLAKESADRKGESFASPEYGNWCLCHRRGKYNNGDGETVTVKKSLQRIRVYLDYDRGEVSFYDPEDMTKICGHRDTFTEKLFPYFGIGKAGDAKTADIKIHQTNMFTFKVFAS